MKSRCWKICDSETRWRGQRNQ